MKRQRPDDIVRTVTAFKNGSSTQSNNVPIQRKSKSLVKYRVATIAEAAAGVGDGVQDASDGDLEVVLARACCRSKPVLSWLKIDSIGLKSGE